MQAVIDAVRLDVNVSNFLPLVTGLRMLEDSLLDLIWLTLEVKVLAIFANGVGFITDHAKSRIEHVNVRQQQEVVYLLAAVKVVPRVLVKDLMIILVSSAWTLVTVSEEVGFVALMGMLIKGISKVVFPLIGHTVSVRLLTLLVLHPKLTGAVVSIIMVLTVGSFFDLQIVSI